MGQNNFAGNVLQVLLGWIQSLFNGIWSLFSGGSGGSLLKWLSGQWISLLIFFLAAGIILDVVVYLLRWKPYWWWFRKKRLVIDDEILERKKPSSKRPSKNSAYRREPSTYIPKRKNRLSDEDFFQDEDSVFSVKTKKKKDVFDVNRTKSVQTSRRTARR